MYACYGSLCTLARSPVLISHRKAGTRDDHITLALCGPASTFPRSHLPSLAPHFLSHGLMTFLIKHPQSYSTGRSSPSFHVSILPLCALPSRPLWNCRIYCILPITLRSLKAGPHGRQMTAPLSAALKDCNGTTACTKLHHHRAKLLRSITTVKDKSLTQV